MRIHLLALCLIFSGLDAGFLKGTKLMTPEGFKRVEELHVGAQLRTYPNDSVTVTHIVMYEPKELYVIETPGVVISVTGEHRFWDPLQQEWIRADKLDSSNWLSDYAGGAYRIIDIAACMADAGVVVYDIFVDSPAKIYVSNAAILLHS